jgi:hypothetical protein
MEIEAALIPLLEDRRLPLNSTGDNEICDPKLSTLCDTFNELQKTR